MVSLNDLSFAIYDASTGDVATIDPQEQTTIPQGTIERGFAEKATEFLYEYHLDWGIEQINQRRKADRLTYALGIHRRSRGWDMPEGFGKRVVQTLREHTDAESDRKAIRAASVDGIPDFIACNRRNIEEFQFVEAKRRQEHLQQTQVDWLREFDFFNIKIVYVFDQASLRDSFVEDNSLKDLYDGAARSRRVDQMDGRQELRTAEIAQRIGELTPGDSVMFNKRKRPVEVIGVNVKREVRGSVENGVEVVTPNGHRYLLSETGEFYVEKDNRRKLNWVQRVPGN